MAVVDGLIEERIVDHHKLFGDRGQVYTRVGNQATTYQQARVLPVRLPEALPVGA